LSAPISALEDASLVLAMSNHRRLNFPKMQSLASLFKIVCKILKIQNSRVGSLTFVVVLLLYALAPLALPMFLPLMEDLPLFLEHRR